MSGIIFGEVMDFKKLRTFQCAALTLNFSKASDQLGYVQSAVTNQIKALEQELDVQLFERNGRGVALTHAGEQLLHYSQKLMAWREEAREKVSNSRPNKAIRIGGHESFITYYLPNLLKDYANHQSEFRLSVTPTPVANLKNDILADRIDVAFILEKTVSRTGLKIHTYQDEEVVIVCAPSHRLANQLSVKPEQLANEHLLLTEAGCCYRNQFERILISAGVFDQHNSSEFVSGETIKACVKLNMGIAPLSRACVDAEIKQGLLQVVNLESIKLSVNVHCVSAQNRAYPESVAKFITYCENYDFSTR